MRVLQRQHDLAQCGRARQEIELLEYEADLDVAQLGKLVGLHGSNVAPVDFEFAARRAIERADQIHHRRFAGARRPHDRNKIPAFDLKRHIIEGAYRLIAHLIGFCDVFSGDQRILWTRNAVGCGLKRGHFLASCVRKTIRSPSLSWPLAISAN